MAPEMSRDTKTGDLPRIEETLADPAASFWLKNALRSALSRDPVDASNDADILARVLNCRCRSILEDSTPI
jgi:hypothetical protein